MLQEDRPAYHNIIITCYNARHLNTYLLLNNKNDRLGEKLILQPYIIIQYVPILNTIFEKI